MLLDRLKYKISNSIIIAHWIIYSGKFVFTVIDFNFFNLNPDFNSCSFQIMTFNGFMKAYYCQYDNQLKLGFVNKLNAAYLCCISLLQCYMMACCIFIYSNNIYNILSWLMFINKRVLFLNLFCLMNWNELTK